MRLTLRTLLAWLDDTLPPAEVKQIGQLVSESPFAQELVERIRKVTRQRRLSVPNGQGADATDPNLVAAYLDNALPSAQVADFEALCLKSDVHLAEVASAHQILSLIGQKAKVPFEARMRMYRLIKGPEAARRLAGPVPAVVVPESPAEDSSVVDEFSRPRPWDGYLPWATALGLTGLLAFAAWKVVGPGPGTPDDDFLATVLPGEFAEPRNTVQSEELPPPGPPFAPNPAPFEPTPAVDPAVAGTDSAPTENAMTDRPAPGAMLRTDVPGSADGTQSILLRHRPDAGSWDRLTGQAGLGVGDRLLSLEPFHTPVRIGPHSIEMIDQAEIRLLGPADDGAPRWQLLRGKVAVRPTEEGRAFELALSGPETPADVTPPNVRILPSTAPIGLEILSMREAGRTSLLRLHSGGGPVIVREGDRELTLDEPSILDLAIAGREAVAGNAAKPSEPKPRSAPEWLTASGPSPTDLQRGESFLKAYRADRDVVAGLLEATASDRKEARELAIAALAAIDDFDLVIEAMGTPNNRAERIAAIKILRSVIDRGPDGRVALAKALERVGGKDVDWADTVEKLLTGFTAEEAAKDDAYTQLVGLLTHQNVEVRELAIEGLQALTRRDALGYDPDNPRRGAALEEWQDLLRKKQLRP